MRKAVTWGRTRYGQLETTYRCAAGCGGRVDKPGNICFGCTMDELRAVLAELDATRRERDELAERVAEAYARLDRITQSANL